ncbi:MAG: preprotein translocase subunit YajC [Cyclobacteriaceae bacterium]|nr:preprotein translocase subunit YajC [Cyclobacteriaceae bacterium]
MIAQILLQQSTGNPMMSNLILIGGIIVIFYFFMIRPQQKKQKDQKKFLEAVKKGDEVVTIGGMHGKVVSVEDDIVVLDVDRGVKLTFEKSSLSLDSSKKIQK